MRALLERFGLLTRRERTRGGLAERHPECLAVEPLNHLLPAHLRFVAEVVRALARGGRADRRPLHRAAGNGAHAVGRSQQLRSTLGRDVLRDDLVDRLCLGERERRHEERQQKGSGTSQACHGSPFLSAGPPSAARWSIVQGERGADRAPRLWSRSRNRQTRRRAIMRYSASSRTAPRIDISQPALSLGP